MVFYQMQHQWSGDCNISINVNISSYVICLCGKTVSLYGKIRQFLYLVRLFLVKPEHKIIPADIYLFRVKNRSTRKGYEICSKFTKKQGNGVRDWGWLGTRL